MRRLRYSFWIALYVTTMGVTVAQGQQQSQGQTQQSQGQTQSQPTSPIPAYRSPLAGMADNGDADNASPQQLVPDNRSLTGAENLSLGGPALVHSYWQPSVDIISSATSNALSPAGQNGWTSYTTILAGFDLHRIAGNNELTLFSTTGGSFSNDGSNSNSFYEDLRFGERLTFRRETLSVFDELDYLPQAGGAGGVGYGGIGGVNSTGLQLGGLQNNFLPGQSILTATGQSAQNTVAVELDTALTHRSSITMVGTYGLLHYFDNNLQDFFNVNAQIGYNYALSQKNTIAVLYLFSAFRYANSPQSINTHSVQFSYSRRVTGKLTFQISAGPQVAFSNIPITNLNSTGTTTTTTTGPTTSIYLTMNSMLQYQLKRTALALTYNHSLTGGSGVLPGAASDVVTGAATRQLTRGLSGGVTVGFSRNTGPVATAAVPPTYVNQTYDYWYTGASLTHPLNRTMNLSLNYQMQYQNSNSAFCIGTTQCATNVLVNTFSVELGWQKHPTLF
jgi:hypothetical protein